MARIAVQKSEAEFPAGKANLSKIGHTEAEQVPVKSERFIEAGSRKHHVPKAHLAGLEAGNRAARMKRLRVDGAPAEDLRAYAAGIHAPDQIDDTAAVGLIPCARGDFHAAILELLRHAVQ